MAGIQANTGLVTGIDIQGTVDKLIAVEAAPRDTLVKKVADTQAKQAAVAQLTANVIAVQLSIKNLEKTALFSQRAVTSSNTTLLSATSSGTGTAGIGQYRFTPVRLAQSQQQLSQGFASTSTALGAGTITIRQGGQVDQGIPLTELNNGRGVQLGKIKITDRSGTTAVIDLRFAQNVDDVLQAINNNETISVQAVAQGDRIQLVDNTGRTTSNLQVQEVGSTTTAADLGLGNINVSSSTATGNDVRGLYNSLALSHLNEGNGLSINSQLADLQVTFQDGSTPLELDFNRRAHGVRNASATTDAAAGIHADIKLTADATGGTYDGVKLKFVSSGTVTKGNETVTFDSNAKTLTVDIEAGVTTANDVIAAINNDATAGPLFTASHGTGSDGTAAVSLTDQATITGGAAVTARTETTLADLLQTINEADPTRLSATISADGDHLEFHDLTSNTGGTFSVTDLNGGSLAGDLGIKAATGATITTRRLLGGLSTPLLHSLNGGQGFGTLGQIALTDRSGATATVDLSNAQTLDDITSAINNSGLGLKASINDTRNGLLITDTTGATVSNLKIANGDANNSATKLHIETDAAVTVKNSGSLNLQTINESTLLSSLNQGQGIGNGSFTITNSNGVSTAINTRILNPKTLGDVIQAINQTAIGVTASINATGDGLLLTDTTNGTGKLQVKDTGNGTVAKNLKIAGQATANTLDGSYAYKVALSATDTLDDLVTKLNDLGGNFHATVLTDPVSSNPYRLSIVSETTGKAGNLTIDDGGVGLGIQELVAGRDALISLGATGSAAGALVSSSTNTFTNAVNGLSVTINSESTDAVTVNVASDVNAISSKIKLFVDQYNTLQDKLDSVDYYNADDGSKGVLFGSSETLQIRSNLSRAIAQRYFADSKLQNISNLGVTFTSENKLQFDADKFNTAYTNDADAVKSFFTDDTKGFAKAFDNNAESIVGIKNSTLVARAQALQTSVDDYNARIAFLNDRLTSSRERLLTTFYNLEASISKIQSSFGSITNSLTNAITASKTA